MPQTESPWTVHCIVYNIIIRTYIASGRRGAHRIDLVILLLLLLYDRDGQWNVEHEEAYYTFYRLLSLLYILYWQ